MRALGAYSKATVRSRSNWTSEVIFSDGKFFESAYYWLPIIVVGM